MSDISSLIRQYKSLQYYRKAYEEREETSKILDMDIELINIKEEILKLKKEHTDIIKEIDSTLEEKEKPYRWLKPTVKL